MRSKMLWRVRRLIRAPHAVDHVLMLMRITESHKSFPKKSRFLFRAPGIAEPARLGANLGGEGRTMVHSGKSNSRSCVTLVWHGVAACARLTGHSAFRLRNSLL